MTARNGPPDRGNGAPDKAHDGDPVTTPATYVFRVERLTAWLRTRRALLRHEGRAYSDGWDDALRFRHMCDRAGIRRSSADLPDDVVTLPRAVLVELESLVVLGAVREHDSDEASLIGPRWREVYPAVSAALGSGEESSRIESDADAIRADNADTLQSMGELQRTVEAINGLLRRAGRQ